MKRNSLSLFILSVTIFATSLPASAQLSPGDINLIGIGAGILNGLLNPPHRAKEIEAEAEVKKAKISAATELEKEKMRIAASQAEDRVTPVLNRWGVSRIICAPGLVFINGIDSIANTVCVQPTKSLAAGYYTYDVNRGQLLRTSPSMPYANGQNPQGVQSRTRLTSTINSQSKGF